MIKFFILLSSPIMKGVNIKYVNTRHKMRQFVRFTARLYENNPCYVPDLEQDIYDFFNPNKNAGLAFSDVQAFLAYDAKGKVVGRIAGIINHHANEKWHTRNVRFGFIEFIDDKDVATALLEAVEQWGREHGMEYIQGPMGIFDFDKEGMLVEDFDQKGSIITIYNPPYYPCYLESLGYEKEVDWIQIRVNVPPQVPDKYKRVAQLSQDMFGLHTRKLTRKEVMQEGYGKKVFQLLNEAFAPLFGFTTIPDKQVEAYIRQYFPFIDLEMVSVVENESGELIGVAITMASLSDAFRKSRGKIFPFGWFHLLHALKEKSSDKAELFLIAVRPDYQGLGVNALFFNDLIPIYNKKGIRWAETGPQLEDNIKELSQWKPLKPTFVKRRRCYRKRI